MRRCDKCEVVGMRRSAGRGGARARGVEASWTCLCRRRRGLYRSVGWKVICVPASRCA